MSTKVSSTFSAFGGSFGASIGHTHIEENTEFGQNIFTESEASCCVYTAELYEFAHPPFHPNFIQGLNSLTEEYVPSIYRRYSTVVAKNMYPLKALTIKGLCK